MMLAGWRKIIIFCLVIVASYIFSSPIMAKTLKNCGAAADPNNLTVYEFYGEVELDNLGIGLDSAGDFNGDGIVDIVAGAPYMDAGAKDGGAAYVFLGGTSADPNWDFRLLAEAENDQLGYSVAGVGDLDNDGFDDIAVGARWSDRAGKDKGAVWVVFGSTPSFGSRQLVLIGNTDGQAGFGHSVAGGDFNNDGFSDLVVGAPFDGPSGEWGIGKVQIFFGGANMDPNVDLTFLGEMSGNNFGWSVACAGDLNADGYDDLVVGARWYGLWPETGRGKAYVYFGGDPMDTTADIELVGENSDDWLGYSVAGAGDVNGDGFDDVLISAPYYPGGSAAGRAYLLYGSTGTSMDNVPDVIFDGAANHDQFGWSVDGGSDMNKDGFDDIIIGARFNDCASQDSGAAYVYYGGDPMDNQPDISAGSAAADDALGTTVAMIGDWSASMPLAVAAAVWNDAGQDVSDPAFGAVFAFTSPACILGDFNRDSLVGWTDLAIFTRRWLDISCDDLNWCGEADLDHNTEVDFGDFALIAERWLQGCN